MTLTVNLNVDVNTLKEEQMGELKFSVPCTVQDYYYVDSPTMTNEEMKAAIKACENDPWQAEEEYNLSVTLGKSMDPETDTDNLEWDDEYEQRKNRERNSKEN